MQKILLATLCTGLLIGGVPVLAAAQTEPATPAPVTPVAAPTVPAEPVAPAATPAGTPAVTPTVAAPSDATALAVAAAALSNDRKELVANALKLSEASKDWSQVYLLGATGTLPDTRISVDQKNTKIKDALKDALDKAKIGYVFDADVPDDARVSVKLDNVKIGTVLDAITESAGLKWQVSVERAGRVGNAMVRVGKKIPGSAGYFSAFSGMPSRDLFASRAGSPNAYTYKTLPGGGATQKIEITPGPSPYTSVFRSRETRSTFTCPNCHNQTTIIRKNVDVKCDTCGRAFESGWKVCPFDGAKRPVAKDDWKFCPICGKSIPDGIASLSLKSDALTEYEPLYSFVPATEIPALTLPAPPVEYR